MISGTQAEYVPSFSLLNSVVSWTMLFVFMDKLSLRRLKRGDQGHTENRMHIEL